MVQLKSALQKLSGQSAIKARVSASVWSKNGEGADATTESAQASVVAELGAFGLRMTYGADLLAKTAAEDDLRERDPKARPATSTTLAAIDQGTVQEVLHAAPVLTRLPRRATRKSETAERFNSQPARKLAFELGPPPMSERDRKYVNKMDGALDVWIAPDGTPLGHKVRSNVAGRAFVVISRGAQRRRRQLHGRRRPAGGRAPRSARQRLRRRRARRVAARGDDHGAAQLTRARVRRRLTIDPAVNI